MKTWTSATRSSTSPPSSSSPRRSPLGAWAEVRWTGRAHGDLGAARPGVAMGCDHPWDDIVDRPVSWARQVHGEGVVVVEAPGHGRGEEGDALVTAHPEAALAIFTADCAPVALASPEGVVGAAHAGWSGVAAGVIERTVEAMRSLGARRVEAALGPCIHAECYEFGADALEGVAAALDGSVRASTGAGAPALDLPAAVAVAVRRAGAHLVYDEDVCTACAGDRYFSHRARGERQRQAMVVWRP